MSEIDAHAPPGMGGPPRPSSAIKALTSLAPLSSLPPQPPANTNTNKETTKDEQPQSQLILDTDEPDQVALLKGEHLLHQRWTFWYDLKDSKATAQNWGMSLKKLMEFESIEQFFGMFNNIAKPSALPVGSDYHLFKYGVKPEWEDPENRNGGIWTWEVRKTDDGAEMDKAWLHTLLGIIGENFSDEKEVVGATCSLRKQRNRIRLWTRSDAQKIAVRIGTEWKKMLALSQTTKLGFQSHAQAMKQSHSRGGETVNQYTV